MKSRAVEMDKKFFLATEKKVFCKQRRKLNQLQQHIGRQTAAEFVHNRAVKKKNVSD
jgi:hypothetical protein